MHHLASTSEKNWITVVGQHPHATSMLAGDCLDSSLSKLNICSLYWCFLGPRFPHPQWRRGPYLQISKFSVRTVYLKSQYFFSCSDSLENKVQVDLQIQSGKPFALAELKHELVLTYAQLFLATGQRDLLCGPWSLSFCNCGEIPHDQWQRCCGKRSSSFESHNQHNFD